MVEPQKLRFPATEQDIRKLEAGDQVLISGRIVTGRDRIHQFLFQDRPAPEELPFPLEGSLIYHCGPIVTESPRGYTVIACGPTTSSRVEMYEWWIIERFGIRAVMGKGGMGEKTLNALRRSGAVYLHTIGGAAVYLAQKITRVVDVWKLREFGMPEAMWLLDVEDFPAVVTMDARGRSLHEEVRRKSEEALKSLID